MIKKYTIYAMLMSLLSISEVMSLGDKWFSAYALKLPVTTSLSFLVKSPGESTYLISHQSDAFRPPASTLKMLTALATRLTYNENHVFTTNLEVLGLNAVLRFSGDPSLQEEDLFALLIAYKKKFGSKIRGDLLLDASIFNGHIWAEGITWENLSACYSAPSSGLTLNDNCVFARLNSHLSVGAVAKVELPSSQSMIVSSDAKIVTKEDEGRLSCSLDASFAPLNHYVVSGCVAQTSRPLSLRFSVQDPEAYTKARITGLLKKANITLVGKIKVQKVKAGKWVAAHDSQPIKALLADMLLESNNLTADHFFKLLGAQYFAQPGNFQNGEKAVKAILKERAGIDLSSAYLADGSGLSRNSRLSAKQMMQVLEYLYTHDSQLNLVSMLPVSGLSGTLQYRDSVKGDALAGRIRAKTGMIYSTHNMAGIIETKAGKPLLFVQMVTDYLPDNEREKPFERKETRINSFEKAVYTDLIQGHLSLSQLVKPLSAG